jgi:hypothetical protein
MMGTMMVEAVRIEKCIAAWFDGVVFLVVGVSGMCYNRKGQCTHLLAFNVHREILESAKDFIFNSRAEAQALIDRLPELRTGQGIACGSARST